MSAMAGYIGGGGLGNFAIAYGYQKFDQTVTWTAVIIMIVLVQVVQAIANAIAKRLLRRSSAPARRLHPFAERTHDGIRHRAHRAHR